MANSRTLWVSAPPSDDVVGKVRLSEHYDHVELWTLRLLTSFESALYDPWDDDRSRWLKIAGLPKRIIDSENDGKIKARLQRRLKEIESNPINRIDPLFTNIGYLADVLGLSPAEIEILTFAGIATRNHYLRGGLRSMHMATREFSIQVLQCLLRIPESKIRVACQKKSTLSAVGLLFNQDRDYADVEELLILEDDLAQHFFNEHQSRDQFLRKFFVQAPRSTLAAADYPHLGQDFRVIVGYLKHTVEVRRPGVNILIYGPPGTGKTQFARVLADSLGMSLYEVGYDDEEDGAALGPEGRLVSYQMCQIFLSRAHAGMVVFEEMEDIFPSEVTPRGVKREHFHNSKAAINNMLEQNPVPTIWISNDVGYLDSAYLRRFDYALALAPPPRSVRRNIIHRYFADLPVPAHYLDSLAEWEELTPAQVERVAKVARHSGIDRPLELGKAVKRMIDSSMTLLGQSRMPQKSGDAVKFGIEFLNIETPLAALIEGLKQSDAFRLCFYGPPGTGKTSFGRYLAEELDRPLMVRRASDLLGRYVGDTEQNIAGMFRTAHDEGALLLLDEADSFLQDRQTARQTWEVTQVNELLTQMESFDGIFVCATNLMDRLDSASLRRFDFKIRFGYLNGEQRWNLFIQCLDGLGYSCLAEEEGALRQSMERMANLTPGDFAVASRQFQILRRKALPSLFLAALEKESEIKPGGGGRMGFV